MPYKIFLFIDLQGYRLHKYDQRGLEGQRVLLGGGMSLQLEPVAALAPLGGSLDTTEFILVRVGKKPGEH